MGILNNAFSSFGNALNFVGEVESRTVTTVANVISSTATGIHDVVSGTTEFISDLTEPMPVINGVVDGAATIIDDAVHGAEIVVHHFAMWGAEPGQAIGTVVGSTGNAIDSFGNGDISGVLCSIKDCIGEIVERDQQYITAHLQHDAELIQIPIKALTEGVIDILKPIFGDNCITNIPSIINDIQHELIDGVILDNIAQPLLDCWAKFNEDVFGDLVGNLSSSDMGMGFGSDGDHGHHSGEYEGHDDNSCGHEHHVDTPCGFNVELVGVADTELLALSI
ncbi:hypothetical protein [Pectobacterium cacticida]|uniref:hypothetical protein n=1 Tax=Pectobacterium cacticida TaxID=69221 RepID=UPI002FF04A76